jgi:calmodulin
MDESKEAFQLFDRDNDGKISSSEIGTILRALGYHPTEAEINQIIKEIGKENIDFSEFSNILEKRKKKELDINMENQIQEAFKIFDKDGNGFVEVSELKHILTSIGEKLTPQEVEGVLKEADSDQDGKISVQDFIKVIKSVKV